MSATASSSRVDQARPTLIPSNSWIANAHCGAALGAGGCILSCGGTGICIWRSAKSLGTTKVSAGRSLTSILVTVVVLVVGWLAFANASCIRLAASGGIEGGGVYGFCAVVNDDETGTPSGISPFGSSGVPFSFSTIAF